MDGALDLFSPTAVADPYSLLADLRTHDPVHWSARHRAWVLTRYDDVVAGFRDQRLSAERIRTPAQAGARDTTAAVGRLLREWMVFKDPPDHGRLRRLVQQAFSPRAVRALEPRVVAIVDDLLDALPSHGEAGVVDLRPAFAAPLPAIVIAELLGVPDTDRDRFTAWSDDLIGVVFGAEGVADRRERAEHGFGELSAYFRALVEDRRNDLSDDLLSALIVAHDEGTALSTDELISTCTLLLFAGHETTTSLITNGLAVLLDAPLQLARLEQDETLYPTAIEELLRFEGPAKIEVRVAARPIELRGRSIRSGDRIFLATCAANRDPAQFADPDHLDLSRNPNAHLGFGFGLHHCLGAPLARLEASIALQAILHRFPDLTAVSPLRELTWHPTLVSRSLATLPVVLGADRLAPRVEAGTA